VQVRVTGTGVPCSVSDRAECAAGSRSCRNPRAAHRRPRSECSVRCSCASVRPCSAQATWAARRRSSSLRSSCSSASPQPSRGTFRCCAPGSGSRGSSGPIAAGIVCRPSMSARTSIASGSCCARGRHVLRRTTRGARVRHRDGRGRSARRRAGSGLVRAGRTHYRAAHVQALVELAECCLALSDPQSAIASASRALALEPTRERGARAAMLAHYTTGNGLTAAASSTRPGLTTPSPTSCRSGSSADPSSAVSSTTTGEPRRRPGQHWWPSSGTPQGRCAGRPPYPAAADGQRPLSRPRRGARRLRPRLSTLLAEGMPMRASQGRVA
jgi:hypothetical protein